jgi:hypothetical protein
MGTNIRYYEIGKFSVYAKARPVLEFSGFMAEEDMVKPGENVHFALKVSNVGNASSHELVWIRTEDGIPLNGHPAILAPGGEAELSFVWVPDEAGTFYIWAEGENGTKSAEPVRVRVEESSPHPGALAVLGALAVGSMVTRAARRSA